MTRLVLAVVGVAVGLAVAEGGLRLAARSDARLAGLLHAWDPDAAALEPLGASCYRARPGSAIRYANGTTAHVNGRGYRGPEVAVPKPSGTYRVVLLGGSTVHGFLVDDADTLDAALRVQLGARASRGGGPRVEVVNLGLDGYDVLCDLERLRRDGVGLAPDALIVHAGVNDALALRRDRLDANAPERGFRVERRRGLDEPWRRSGTWRALKRQLMIARVPGIARELRRAGAPAPGPAEPTVGGLDAFEATVRAIVAAVPPATTVLLSMPPTLAAAAGDDARPTCGTLIVDGATTDRYRARIDARLQRVAADLAATRGRVAYVPHALPAEHFLDDCHLDGAGNRRLAEELAGALAGALAAVPLP